MPGYQPLYIRNNTTGLVQSREEFLLPEDAYPYLQNAFVWRERIKRKQGNQYLGQLQRYLSGVSLGTIAGSGTFSVILSDYLIAADSITPAEVNAQIVPGTSILPLAIIIGSQILSDTLGTGILTISGAGNITAATLSYSSTILTLTVSAPISLASSFTGAYFPGLPVMGLRTEETINSAFDETIAFDTVYSYVYNSITELYEEFEPGTTWTGSNTQFFWSTNYFVGVGDYKIFWVTNNKDPIRFTNGQPGTGWFDFLPIINAAGDILTNALALLPFRGRLVAFNTTESGVDGGIRTNRIRWSAIGTPFTMQYGNTGPGFNNVIFLSNPKAWLDDVRGQGGFLDIPTSEDITAVGFVRDNVVIYCERSTWQLRYTGRSIAPFQIERVNSELGAQSLFSAVQFDTSLVGIGDKGVVECDSYKSERIDIKIPDFVFTFSNADASPTNIVTARVHGIRDFVSRLAYWTYLDNSSDNDNTFPDKRLVYNYDNDSWAIFDDTFTCFGTFQLTADRTWINTNLTWQQCNFDWLALPEGDPCIVAGNQQGFVQIVANQLNGATVNQQSLYIKNITANVTTPTSVNSPNHNLLSDTIIEISGILPGTSFANLNTGINPNTGLPFNRNNGVFSIIVVDASNFLLMIYNPETGQFSTEQLDPVPATPYIGQGYITIRDNFDIVSKKFNFVEQGQSIQMGYLDILMSSTAVGAITMNVYQDYQNDAPTNNFPQNEISGSDPPAPDAFFNTIIPTYQNSLNTIGGEKFFQRVLCPTRANFLSIEYTLSNAQMAGIEQQQDVQIDSQVLWMRLAGRLSAGY
jgi:hypothetical protein